MGERFILKEGYSAYDSEVVYDKITKKAYPCTTDYEDIVDLLNNIWEQTLRFEEHNQELVQRSMKYEEDIDELKYINTELKTENKRIDEFNNCLIHILKINNIKLDKYFKLEKHNGERRGLKYE